MIGCDDDLLNYYLETEIDENFEKSQNLKSKNIEDDGEEIVNEEEQIKEIPTDTESEEHFDNSQEQEHDMIVLLDADKSKSIDNNLSQSIAIDSDNIEIELTGAHKNSSDDFYDVFDEDFPCSIQLTEPNYSQLLDLPVDPFQEICRLCNFSDTNDNDNWLICFGCGEAFHRKCLKEKLRKVKCEMPLIYRNRLEGPEEDQSKKFTHAPWFCNNCVQCSHCEIGKIEEDEADGFKRDLKDSFVSCRHCGKVTCLSCYNSESFSNNSIPKSRFSDLKNYNCSACLQCINCGISAFPPPIEGSRRRSISMDKHNVIQTAKKSVILYNDLTLCRPCYLSNQICATCPRCNQIYHSLPDHYDFGETKFDPDFSLCPMICCDECGSWTHCQCEGIDEEEYERIGTDSSAKFICVNCKPKLDFKRKKSVKFGNFEDVSDFLRIGNLMVKDERIIFNFWSFSEPWKRQKYELTFTRRKGFSLLECDKKIIIEANSVEKLILKFKEKFKNAYFDGINCVKAINPSLLLNPMRLLSFLEPTRRFQDLCANLRDEILRIDEFVCARTRPFEAVKNSFAKRIVNEKRRLSLTSLSETRTIPVPISNTGKMTVKFFYSQYVHTLKSDLSKSINTIDAISCGLALRPSAISGFGLFATRPFQKNSLIIEYCGEMLTGEGMVNKRDIYYNSLGKRYKQSCYLFRLDELKVLDATFKGNISRFINHSCDPNCYSRVVQIDANKKLLIFAGKVIEAGEEIVYDYKFPDEDQKIPCLCGSEKCRKWMN